jgi:hypothetical protein
MAKTMVIGASGSIGSVSARLLAMAFDEVVIAGRDLRKLEELKASILQDTPEAKVVCSTDYDSLLGQMDMIVTSTSGAGKKILDIMKVKPGCVITDVARPLDLPPEEVAKRPDVLVIESGEIELPSKVKGLKSIGLPPNIVYACLAETIVLALEGRFEVFTIGRDTEWQKVKEIYRLGLKHGMKLAAISGVKGVYSDEDIQRVVELARKARRKWDARGAAAAKAAPRKPRRAGSADGAQAPAGAAEPVAVAVAARKTGRRATGAATAAAAAAAAAAVTSAGKSPVRKRATPAAPAKTAAAGTPARKASTAKTPSSKTPSRKTPSSKAATSKAAPRKAPARKAASA